MFVLIKDKQQNLILILKRCGLKKYRGELYIEVYSGLDMRSVIEGNTEDNRGNGDIWKETSWKTKGNTEEHCNRLLKLEMEEGPTLA